MQAIQTPKKPVVKIGERIYNGQHFWRRQDDIFLDDVKIGIIKLAINNRPGSTISLKTTRCIPGRNVQWCVEQSSPPN